MRMWRKFSAVAFALVMMLAISAVALADPVDLSNGKVGDKTTTVDNTVNIKKEIKAFNANSSSVFAPAFSYTYTVTPASVDSKTVTDSDNIAVNVKAGVTTGLKVNSGSAGNGSSASGVLSFTNEMSLAASNSGTVNTYNIPLDFSNVSFATQGYGVYRYQITETLTGDGAEYSHYGLVDGNGTDTAVNTVYLDVYVNGSGDIYGYVCMTENAVVTEDTAKTNGFVGAGMDRYYTYDLDVSKTVTNDSFGQTLQFPFTVTFTPGTGMIGANFKITETAAEGSVGIGSNSAVNAGSTGVAQVKHGAAITYTGIPCGVNVTIYETNNNVGVTYSAVTTVNGAESDAEQIIATTTDAVPAYAVQNSSKNAYETTARTVTTTVGTAVAAKQTFNINNTLVLISPTGVTLRYAPYLAMLGAGIVALPLSIRRKREDF